MFCYDQCFLDAIPKYVFEECRAPCYVQNLIVMNPWSQSELLIIQIYINISYHNYIGGPANAQINYHE